MLGAMGTQSGDKLAIKIVIQPNKAKVIVS